MLLVWLLVLTVELVAFRTTPLIPYADDLQNELSSDSAAYRRYAAYQKDYAPEGDSFLVLIEAEDLTDPASYRAINDFLIELHFLPHVQSILSPFSFSVPVEDGALPLFSGDPDAATLRVRLKQALEELPLLDTLLSADLDTMQALVLISGFPSDTRLQSEIIAEYRALAAQVSDQSPLTITLTGYPVLSDAFNRKLDADAATLNNAGVLVCLVVAWITLRSLTLALVIALTAHTTRLWSIAALQPFGYAFDAATITLPTLIVVLAFSEAIHLVMAARRTFHDGGPTPLLRALGAVWPAATLAALTTCGAFAALQLSPSDMVADLAFFGIVAILVSTPLTLGLICLVTVTADQFLDVRRILRPPLAEHRRIRVFAPLERLISKHAGGLSLAGVVIVGFSIVGYLNLEPNESLFDGLRPHEPEMQALHKIEATFGPVTTLVFEHPLEPAADLARARQALSDLSPWGEAFALTPPEIAELPELLRARVLSRDGTRTLISVPYDYDGSAKARDDIAALQGRIDNHPDLRMLGQPTGLVHVTSLVTGDILAAFSLSFALAAAAAGLCISAWLRNLPLGLLAVIPNVLPITMVGTIMWLFELSFDYTSAVALTIAFGVAIDDTVHMINRIRAEAGADRQLTEEVVRRGLRGIGPTLMLTSVILIGGLSSTLFSSLPALVFFGLLSISVFVLALLADLVLLPALFIWYARHPATQARNRFG